MKLKTFAPLVLIGLLMNVFYVSAETTGPKQIALKGKFDPIGSRSVVDLPVSAQQMDDVILVDFTQALGTINVTISSEAENIFSTSFNVTGASQFTIYIGDYEPGIYVLKFTNASGGCVYGEFIIE